MDDDQVKKLREYQVYIARKLGEHEDAKERSEMQLAAFPGNWAVRLGAWLINLGHRLMVQEDQKARKAASKTYDR